MHTTVFSDFSNDSEKVLTVYKLKQHRLQHSSYPHCNDTVNKNSA